MSAYRLGHSKLVAFTLLVVLICAQSVTQARALGGGAELRMPVGGETERFAKKLRNLRRAIRVHRRNIGRLRDLRGVVASGTGLDADGKPLIRVFVDRTGLSSIPALLDDVRVRAEISGRFYARRGPTCDSSGDNRCENDERWPLPVPIGVSVGHPAVTAGSIGARLTDGTNVFILSNNHVMAASNQTKIGDPIMQPGVFDGGRMADDSIATLSDFEPIKFCDPVLWRGYLLGHDCSASSNAIDAAIALTTRGELGFATPRGEHKSIAGYGAPRSRFHPAYDDGELSDLLGVSVKKYGRSTALTSGTVSTVDATVEVCYDPSCISKAIFVDQLVITGDGFSSGGDSGSLVIDAANRPVGLLFAGSETSTIANRIDEVMQRFVGLSIDDGTDTAPLTDVAVTEINVSANPMAKVETDVTITVRNQGKQAAPGFEVLLADNGVQVGNPNTVSALSRGESTERTFKWTPPAAGTRTLWAAVSLEDGDSTNNVATRDVTVRGGTASGPMLSLWRGFASTEVWTTVTVGLDYGGDMVVVCTPSYDVSDLAPAVVRIRNAVGSSFEVGLAQPMSAAASAFGWSAKVHCMVMRAGVYNEAEHGVKLEAVKLSDFFAKDDFQSWLGEGQAYANRYNAPVVVGQVMSAAGSVPDEIGDWSVFWARGAKRTQPPTPDGLYVGRHTGEDLSPRKPVTLAYIVVEQGTGSIDSIGYVAGLGTDTVRGVANSPPYAYEFTGVSSPSVAILGQAGMDGFNGGWPILYGANPLTDSTLSMAIDEDTYGDGERGHTSEQVGYIIFD